MTQRNVTALALIFTIVVGLGVLAVRDQFFAGRDVEGQAPSLPVQTSTQISNGTVRSSTDTTQGLFGGTSGVSSVSSTIPLSNEASSDVESSAVNALRDLQVQSSNSTNEFADAQRDGEHEGEYEGAHDDDEYEHDDD